jgi:hypothetical protein
MKVLFEVNVNQNDFDLINDQKSPRQLYRVNQNHQYVLALFDGRHRLFKFESEVLTEVLNDLGGGVRDVTLVEFKEQEFGTASECGFEIRLYLKNKDMVIITENDEVRYYLPARYKEYIASLSVLPVSDIWDLPDEDPFNFLEVSQGLKKRIDPFIDNAGPAEVIRRMWFDYTTLVLSRSDDVEDGYVTYVQGEFIDFTVVQTPDEQYYLEIAELRK